jgi:hypothetical protein
MAHFFTTLLPITNIRPTTNPVCIRNPNGSTMHSTHEAELDLPQLPLCARRVHVVLDLQSWSLLSIAQLCDAGCVAIFTRMHVNINHQDTCILTSERDPTTNLWHIHVPTKSSPLTSVLDTHVHHNECNSTIGLP